jgi:hypothetical protein
VEIDHDDEAMRVPPLVCQIYEFGGQLWIDLPGDGDPLAVFARTHPDARFAGPIRPPTD